MTQVGLRSQVLTHPFARFKRVSSVDLETHLIKPGLLTPPIVCGSVAEVVEGRIQGKLLYPHEVIDLVRKWLADPDRLITNANIAFDLAALIVAAPDLLRLVFRAYKDGRIFDLLVAQALHAIAHGHLFKEKNGLPLLSSKGTQTDRYSLDIVVRQELHRTDAKINDFWKLRYAILEPLRHEDWPEEARQYPVDDACNALEVTLRQLGFDGREPHDNLADLPAQVETDWALHLGAIWGLRSDESRLDLLEARAQELHVEYVKKFANTGFFRKPRQKYIEAGKVDPEAGKKDTCAVARAVAAAYGASGTCKACRGTGHNPVPCRGEKIKGRFKGCGGKTGGPCPNCKVFRQAGGLACTRCNGTGSVIADDGESTCPNCGGVCFISVQEVTCAVCAGTGSGGPCATCGGDGLLFRDEGTVCKACAGTGFGEMSTVLMTDAGAVSTSRDTLSEAGDDLLAEFGDNKHEKILKTYSPWLRKGTHHALTLEPNVLLESARAAYRGPIQLFPRDAMGVTADGQWVPTSRECIVARDGCVLGSNDFAAGELCGLGQICLWLFGHSRMADIINESRTPGALHTEFAAKLTGESPAVMKARVKAGDAEAKRLRTAAKSTNFAMGGGMGSPKFVLTNRKEGAGSTEGPDGRTYPGIRFCILVGGARECSTTKVRQWGRPGYEREIPPTCKACLDVAQNILRPLWFEMFPEVKEYHEWVKVMLERHNNVLPCFGPWWPARGKPHRVRDVSDSKSVFSAGANNGFQGIIADATKMALRLVTREAYLDAESVLYKARARFPVFAHDELISELLEEWAHLAGPRISELMMEAYHYWIPDVYGEAEPTLMRAWNKSAEPVYDENKKLLVWEPKAKVKK